MHEIKQEFYSLLEDDRSKLHAHTYLVQGVVEGDHRSLDVATEHVERRLVLHGGANTPRSIREMICLALLRCYGESPTPLADWRENPFLQYYLRMRKYNVLMQINCTANNIGLRGTSL